MSTAITKCSVLILAAGQSSRLGRPKQLLEFEGVSLLRRTVNTALESGIGKLYVVVGAKADKIASELDMPGICLVENEGWAEGMASSIRAGLEAVQKEDTAVDGVMILVCDQPYLQPGLLQEILMQQQTSGLPMAASVYQGKMGTPAVFHRSVFPKLMALQGDTGARKIFSTETDQVVKISFEQGIVDIDTKEDYEKLIHNQ